MLSQLELDMVILGDICRWQPSEIMSMSIDRRRRLAEVLVERRRQANSAPPDPNQRGGVPAGVHGKRGFYVPKLDTAPPRRAR